MESSETNYPQISRRVVLKYAGVFAFGVLINFKEPPAQAIAVGAVVAVAQAGIALAGILGPKGPGLAELIQAQAEMLKNISKQLDSLNDHLKEIDKHLDEIEVLVLETPTKTVTLSLRADIVGALENYHIQFETYTKIKNKGGAGAIQSGRAEIKPELVALVLNRIAAARGTIIADSDFGANKTLIPLLAAAMYTEIRSRIFVRSQPENIVVVLKHYRNYFQKWLDGSFQNNLLAPIKKLKANRVEIIRNAQIPMSGDPFLVERKRSGCGSKSPEGIYETQKISYSLKRRQFVFNLALMKSKEWNRTIGMSSNELKYSLQMISVGTLASLEGFLIPTATFTWLDTFTNEYPHEIQNPSQSCSGSETAEVLSGDGVTKVQVSSLPKLETNPECKKLEKLPSIPPHNLTALHENTRELIAFRSLEGICREAVEFCDRFTHEIEAHQGPI
jgi:hypothetical protein